MSRNSPQVVDGQVSASIPDLPDFFAAGDSAQEAMEHLSEAARLYIDDMEDKGLEIPPARAKVARLEVSIKGM